MITVQLKIQRKLQVESGSLSSLFGGGVRLLRYDDCRLSFDKSFGRWYKVLEMRRHSKASSIHSLLATLMHHSVLGTDWDPFDDGKTLLGATQRVAW